MVRRRRPAQRAVSWIGDRARSALLRATTDPPEERPRPDGEPLRFLFTIDTEISMGGALRDTSLDPVGADKRIWGDTDSGRHGIELFMDVFEEFGLRGVFFFEVCGRNVVEAQSLQEAAHCITERGHDAELHVHPEFRVDIHAVREGEVKKPSAHLFDYAYEEQRELIRTTTGVLAKWTGRRPIAFRAGGFALNARAQDAVKAEGLLIDSSYSAWAVENGICKLSKRPFLNDVAMLTNGLIEVPVTNLETKGPRAGLRHFDLAALNATEAIAALEDAYTAGMRVVCSLTHSFRLMRTTSQQYSDADLDAFNLHRLRAICRFLAENKDRFEVCTYRDLPLERWATELKAPPKRPHFPTPPAWASVTRMAVQAIKDHNAL